MKHYLYLLINTDLNKVYVGVTIDPASRLHTHLYGNSTNFLIKRDREVYNFYMDIIASGSHDEIYQLEAEMIEYLDSLHPNGYNLASGGFGGCTKETAARGERQGHSILTDKEVVKLRNMYEEGYSQAELATIFNTSRSNVSMICSGKTWTHLEPCKPKKEAKIAKAKMLHEKGMKPKDIAKTMSIGLTSVYRYINDT